MLVALAWPNHVHHSRAIRWFRGIRDAGWATCPVTETGFVRVSSNARVIPDARTPAEAIALLREMRRLPGHSFWTDDVSPGDSDASAFAAAVGYRQITDAHLVTLAVRNKGRLASFDAGITELLEESAQEIVELIR